MAATGTNDYWTGLRRDLTGLVIDTARSRLIDVETKDSDKTVRDGVDARLGDSGAGVGGMSVVSVAIIAVVVVVGVILAKRVL